MALVTQKPWEQVHQLQRIVSFGLRESVADLSVYRPNSELNTIIDKISKISDQLQGQSERFQRSEFFFAWKEIAQILSVRGDFDYKTAVKQVWIRVSLQFRTTFPEAYVESLNPLVVLCSKVVYTHYNVYRRDIMRSEVGEVASHLMLTGSAPNLEDEKLIKKEPHDDKALKLAAYHSGQKNYSRAIYCLVCTTHPKVLICALDILLQQHPDADDFRFSYPLLGKKVELILARLKEYGSHSEDDKALRCLLELPVDHPWKAYVFSQLERPQGLYRQESDLLERLKEKHLKKISK